MSETEPDPEDAANWEEACRREDAVRKFVLRQDDNRKSPTVKELAQELGLSRATVYRMIGMFRADGTVTSLMGKAPGRRRGYRALDPKRDALIQETIELFYLKPTKPSVARHVHEIRTRCLALGLPPPNWRTVKARITVLDARAKARKRGEFGFAQVDDGRAWRISRLASAQRLAVPKQRVENLPVLFGVTDAREAISGDVQLARRFDELTLPRWSADTQYERSSSPSCGICLSASPRS